LKGSKALRASIHIIPPYKKTNKPTASKQQQQTNTKNKTKIKTLYKSIDLGLFYVKYINSFKAKN